MFLILCFNVFFFKQKTAYEMHISDWSSDVCSSDLEICGTHDIVAGAGDVLERDRRSRLTGGERQARDAAFERRDALFEHVAEDRKSVVSGKSVSGRVDLGGGRVIKKKRSKQK